MAELTLRTNRCTYGIRYTIDQQKIQNENYKLYFVYASDRYSNLGLVGAIGISVQILGLFVLSCRVLGRGGEEQMVEIIKRIK